MNHEAQTANVHTLLDIFLQQQCCVSVLYPVQGELGSDPRAPVLLVKLSVTESSFRYNDGFFTAGG